MDNDSGSSSNTSGQPSNGPVNQPGSQAEEKKTTNWRMLVVASAIVLILLTSGIYLSLTNPYSGYQEVNISEPSRSTTTITPTSASEESKASLTPAAALEIPPLFPGLTVKQRQEGTLFKTEDPDGPAQTLGMRVEANIRSAQDVELIYELASYYHEYFSKYNWRNYLVADRPGNNINGWKKDGRYFIIEIRVNEISGTTSAFLLYNQPLDSPN